MISVWEVQRNMYGVPEEGICIGLAPGCIIVMMGVPVELRKEDICRSRLSSCRPEVSPLRDRLRVIEQVSAVIRAKDYLQCEQMFGVGVRNP